MACRQINRLINVTLSTTPRVSRHAGFLHENNTLPRTMPKYLTSPATIGCLRPLVRSGWAEIGRLLCSPGGWEELRSTRTRPGKAYEH